jgi:curved DNA-binding protein CbpA
MTTLYELLGTLPDDDAETLRTAFRKAVKASHPDSNPDDPNASRRFRQVVRAHQILSDGEQRATYDQLLAIALAPDPAPKSKPAVSYERIHKLASDTIAATIISGLLVGGYALLGQASKAPADGAVDARGPIEMAMTLTGQPDLTSRNESRDNRENTGIVDGAAIRKVAAPGAQAIINLDAPLSPAKSDGKSYHERGIFAYRDGDYPRALADFDLAIQRDPAFPDAYVNRGIVFYRLGQFERAFADMARAKHLENANRTRTAARGPRKTQPNKIRDTISN